MNENLKLFRVYDTKTKEYLFAFNTKEKAKIIRDEKEHALPKFQEGTEGYIGGEAAMNLPPQYIIRENKHYKYRFQIRRAIDHRKGEN